MNQRILFWSAVFFSQLTFSAFALLPPLSFVIKDVFENRKAVPTEAIIKHQIEIKGEKIEVEERILRDRNQVRIVWKAAGITPIPVSYEKHGYVLAPGRGFPSRTALF